MEGWHGHEYSLSHLMDTPYLMDGLSMSDRRCTAIAKSSGERCKRRPILGGNVCKMHGGGAPQVKRSARERLEALVDPAIKGLREAMKSGDVQAIVRAATVVLDRTGFAPRYVVELEQRAVDRLREEERGWLFRVLDEISKTKKPMTGAHFVELLIRRMKES